MEKQVPESGCDIPIRLENQPLSITSLFDNTAGLDRTARVFCQPRKTNEFVRKIRENDLRFHAVVECWSFFEAKSGDVHYIVSDLLKGGAGVV